MKEEKYYGIFETSFGWPVITKKKHTKKELEDIWKKSKVEITIDELGLDVDYNILGGFTYCNDKETAKELRKALTLKWWKEKGQYECMPSMLEEILGEKIDE